MISVEDIMLEKSSEDDDVPIVATLHGKKDNLSLLVNVATAPIYYIAIIKDEKET